MFPSVGEFAIAVIGVWLTICVCAVLYEFGKKGRDR